MAIINKIEEIKTKQDEVADFLKTIPFSKVDNYVDNNVTDLASAKTLLKKMIKAILWLYKEN